MCMWRRVSSCCSHISAPLTCWQRCGESSWVFLQEDAVQRREGWQSQGTAAKILWEQSLLPAAGKLWQLLVVRVMSLDTQHTWHSRRKALDVLLAQELVFHRIPWVLFLGNKSLRALLSLVMFLQWNYAHQKSGRVSVCFGHSALMPSLWLIGWCIEQCVGRI